MNEQGYDAVYIVNQIMSSKFLLKHIREEGGAYGTNAMHTSGYALFSSYDDPNVLRTINQFIKGCEWIRNGEYTEKDIVEARLSLFGDIDEVVSGKTTQMRQEQRDLLLNVTKDQLVDIANKAYESDASMQTFVFGNKHSVKEVENKDDWVIEDLACSLCSTNRKRKLGY